MVEPDPAPSGLDCFGLAVSTASPDCIEAVNSYYNAVLAYKPFSSWAVVDQAASVDPHCPMARLLSADYAACRGDGVAALKLLAELAEDDAQSSWTWREGKYIEAWTKWVAKSDPAGCYEVLKEVVVKHPEDLFAVKRGHIMGLILGDGEKIMSIVEVAASSAPISPPPRFLHGMWAFGLEQCGEYVAAEAKAREGLSFEAQIGGQPDAWLDHGLAHALYFQGEERLDEAIDFLEERSKAWSADGLHPFLYTHNWWHLSLLYCENRDFDDAARVFDEHLWAEANAPMRADPQVQLNALNLLWRLETRGKVEISRPRFPKVLAACEGFTLPRDGAAGSCQHCDLLLDVLIVRALAVVAASAPAPLDAFLAAVSAHAAGMAASGAEGAGGRAEAYAEIAHLIAALFRTDQPESGIAGRQSEARKRLRELQGQWKSIGGSDEQRLILLEAVEGPIVCGSPEKNYDSLFL